MERCKSCKHRGDDGFCSNEDKIFERYAGYVGEDCLIYSYSEGGGFWVGPEFGCVHHDPK